ncbi:MAG: uracil-DNA glycosylase [Verrucomicrobiota bacterium]
MSDVFTKAVEFVFEALNARQRTGSTLKVEFAALEPLLKGRTEKPVPVPAPPVSVKPPSPMGGAETVTSRLLEFPTLPSEVDDGGLQRRLAALKVAVSGCVQCPNLVATRVQVVFGEGNPAAELMFVGESPGPEEEAEGRCLAGADGELFDKMLLAMGLSRAQVFLTTVLKCRPDVPAGSVRARQPSVQELGRCLPYLAAQIALVKPKVIVALGAGAVRGLFGATQTVSALRSRWHDLQGIPVMPTFHPNYLILNGGIGEKRKVWEDLLQVLERLEHPITQKQRNYFLRSAQ